MASFIMIKKTMNHLDRVVDINILRTVPAHIFNLLLLMCKGNIYVLFLVHSPKSSKLFPSSLALSSLQKCVLIDGR